MKKTNKKSGSAAKTKINSLHQCLIIKLKALYDIEQQLVKALPKMAKKAKSPELQQAFIDHLAETEGHVRRLEASFDQLVEKPAKITVAAIRGLADDAAWVMEQKGSDAAYDSLLIASAQYVEFYEMAGYMSAIEWAEKLGYTEVAQNLQATLAEEEAADDTLSNIAQKVNVEATLPQD